MCRLWPAKCKFLRSVMTSPAIVSAAPLSKSLSTGHEPDSRLRIRGIYGGIPHHTTPTAVGLALSGGPRKCKSIKVIYSVWHSQSLRV
ncbi:hypothetical protein BC834DRAFT_520524 [Gloeopeniophorella convolvens]|nr:hypothetical protein BC834DRAFT_520524 [Gloeopeniophorella convolvens]